MTVTKHNNIQLIPTGPVEWPALVNDLITKYEAGRTLHLVAGETIAKYEGFKLDSTSRALVGDVAGINLGIWQSLSTAVDETGFGQYAGTMEYDGWNWTAGTRLYLTSAGALTDSSSGNSDQIAIATDSTEILITPTF